MAKRVDDGSVPYSEPSPWEMETSAPEKLKQPPRPKRPSKKTYWEKLKDPRWQRKRLEVMEAAEFECISCGDAESTLNVHHRWYISGMEPWDYGLDQLECLCEKCHLQAEQLRKRVAKLLSMISTPSLAELVGMLVGHFWLRCAEGDSPVPLSSEAMAEGIAATCDLDVRSEDVIEAFGENGIITLDAYIQWWYEMREVGVKNG